MSNYSENRISALTEIENLAIIRDGVESEKMLSTENIGNAICIDPAPPIFEKTMESPLHDPKEVILKKLYGSAIVMAQKKGLIPTYSPEATAVLADKSVSMTKVAIQVATDQIDSEQVAEYVADKAVTVATTIAQRVLTPEKIGMGLNRCIDYISVYCPPAQMLKAYVPGVSSFISEKANKLVVEAMPKVRQTIKQVVKKTVDKVKEGAKALANAAFNFVKSLVTA